MSPTVRVEDEMKELGIVVRDDDASADAAPVSANNDLRSSMLQPSAWLNSEISSWIDWSEHALPQLSTHQTSSVTGAAGTSDIGHGLVISSTHQTSLADQSEYQYDKPLQSQTLSSPQLSSKTTTSNTSKSKLNQVKFDEAAFKKPFPVKRKEVINLSRPPTLPSSTASTSSAKSRKKAVASTPAILAKHKDVAGASTGMFPRSKNSPLVNLYASLDKLIHESSKTSILVHELKVNMTKQYNDVKELREQQERSLQSLIHIMKVREAEQQAIRSNEDLAALLQIGSFSSPPPTHERQQPPASQEHQIQTHFFLPGPVQHHHQPPSEEQQIQPRFLPSPLLSPVKQRNHSFQ